MTSYGSYNMGRQKVRAHMSTMALKKRKKERKKSLPLQIIMLKYFYLLLSKLKTGTPLNDKNGYFLFAK